MVKAIGIDIVDVDRIRLAMKNPRFVERILTSREQERAVSATYLAGRWAAKEAAAKCIPALRNWHDIEVLSEADGSPKAHINAGIIGPGEAILLSITHERGHAAAVAILVTK